MMMTDDSDPEKNIKRPSCIHSLKHFPCKPYVWPWRKQTEPYVSTVPEVNWSSEGVVNLIPYEDWIPLVGPC